MAFSDYAGGFIGVFYFHLDLSIALIIYEILYFVFGLNVFNSHITQRSKKRPNGMCGDLSEYTDGEEGMLFICLAKVSQVMTFSAHYPC